MYVCILAIKHGKNTYTHTLTETRAIHSYTKLVYHTFSDDFWHKVSVSKNCFRAAQNTLPYTHFANEILPFALFLDIYRGKYNNF